MLPSWAVRLEVAKTGEVSPFRGEAERAHSLCTNVYARSRQEPARLVQQEASTAPRHLCVLRAAEWAAAPGDPMTERRPQCPGLTAPLSPRTLPAAVFAEPVPPKTTGDRLLTSSLLAFQGSAPQAAGKCVPALSLRAGAAPPVERCYGNSGTFVFKHVKVKGGSCLYVVGTLKNSVEPENIYGIIRQL